MNILTFKQHLWEGCIQKSGKTGETVDFTTDCPKRRAGKPCKYCYVECARNMGFNAKKTVDYLPYKGEVKKYSKERVAEMNAKGGIRLFSFGDYMPEHDEDIKKFLDDAHSVGLTVKAITKQPDFVRKYAKHPAMGVINVSIDTVGDGVDHQEALELKKQYKNVVIRTVIMNDADLDAEIMKDVDVFTFNHGKGLKRYGYKMYSKKEVAEYAKKMPGKVCCETGVCSTCKVKCGQVRK